jgi:hypothetical protein
MDLLQGRYLHFPFFFFPQCLVSMTVHRYKSRLCARGFKQTYGINYHETFAPVTRFNTLHLLFCYGILRIVQVRPLVIWDIGSFKLPTSLWLGTAGYGDTLLLKLSTTLHTAYTTCHEQASIQKRRSEGSYVVRIKLKLLVWTSESRPVTPGYDLWICIGCTHQRQYDASDLRWDCR